MTATEMAPLRVGFYLPLEPGDPYDPDLLEAVLEAEDAGFDAVWIRDLPLASPTISDSEDEHEAVTLAAFLAAPTSRIRIGTAVVSLPFRHPVLLARQAASLDALSNGRFILGVGSGYRADLYDVFDVPFEDRHARARESVQLMRRLWTGEQIRMTTSTGRLDGQYLRPLPVTPGGPPVYLAARTPPVGDALDAFAGWMSHRGRLSSDAEAARTFHSSVGDGRAKAAVLDLAVALGEPPETKLDIPFYNNILSTDTNGLRHALGAYHRAGYTDIILAFVGSMPRREQARLVAAEVIPRLDTVTEKLPC